MNKKLISLLLLLFLFCFTETSIAARLVWDPPSEGVPTGYNVKYGQSSELPETVVNVGNVTEYYLDNAPLVESTTYYFWVTAYNEVAESLPAGPVSYTTTDNTPPSPPTGLTVN